MLEESKKIHNKRDQTKLNEDVDKAICFTKMFFCSGTKNKIKEPIRGSIIKKDSIFDNCNLIIIAGI